MESVNIGHAVIIRSFEDRLVTMAEEYDALLKDSADTISGQWYEINELRRQVSRLVAERDFAEKQIDRIQEILG